MNQTPIHTEAYAKATTAGSPRKPYVAPVIETLGGTLATLLASGCAPCTICPPDPGADTP